MKEKKIKKPVTIEEQISLTKVSVVIFCVLTVIWLGLGIAKLVEGDEWWITAIDFFVGVLSGVDALLGVIRLKRLKKVAADSQAEAETPVE